MFERAAALPSDYVFPNRLEDVLILEAAQKANPQDGRAPYYLGNFWYAHRRNEEAIASWEKAAELDGTFATVYRNLGLAYFNKRDDSFKALAYFEKAFALNPADARVFFELDQLYKRLNRGPNDRLAIFQANLELVEQRDDLMIEYITLLNLLGRCDEAYQALMRRNFHPWEGGEGKVTGQYVTSLVEKARTLIDAGEAGLAIELLEQARDYPHNLGEGKLCGAEENNIFYYLGCAYEQLGQLDQARIAFSSASTGLNEPGSAMYYNDQPPDMIFYQGLALRKLEREKEAQATFRRLVDYGNQHMNDNIVMDYFAVSLPDFLVFDVDLNERNRTHCHYMLGLGYLGLGDQAAAREHFEAVLVADANHLGVASVAGAG
jgi:tetratricopeptide (TPR) repeat protein